MNLTLHQFRKEARYLRLRWLLWLVLLALLLAVELEWVIPMGRRIGVADPEFVGGLRWAVQLFALWLAASSATEDLPGKPSRFLAARPLPMSSYFAARILVVLVLVITPFAVWEALYLAFSGRPLSEIFLGAGEAAVVSALLYGWILPLVLMWRGTERWGVVIGVMAV